MHNYQIFTRKYSGYNIECLVRVEHWELDIYSSEIIYLNKNKIQKHLKMNDTHFTSWRQIVSYRTQIFILKNIFSVNAHFRILITDHLLYGIQLHCYQQSCKIQ